MLQDKILDLGPHKMALRCEDGRVIEFLVKVKNSSPKSLSVYCRPTVGQLSAKNGSFRSHHVFKSQFSKVKKKTTTKTAPLGATTFSKVNSQ